MAVQAPYYIRQNFDKTQVEYVKLTADFAGVYAVTAFAFFSQSVVLPLKEEIKRDTHSGMRKVNYSLQ